MNVILTAKPAPHHSTLSPGPSGQSGAGTPARTKPPFKFVVFFKQLYRRLRNWRTYVPPNAVAHGMAVKQFLDNVMGVTSRTFPSWQKTIEDGLAEHNAHDNRQSDLSSQYPLDDFFFAGFVALEAAKIPSLYDSAEADVLFSVIADQLDVTASRHDRLVSDMFFEVIARLNLLQINPNQKQPYDKVVKVILKRLGFDKTEAGKMLLADKAFRQLLAEPFALYAPQWWEKFKAKFVLYQPASLSDADGDDQEAIANLIAKTEASRKAPKRRWRKPAESLFG